MRPFLCFCSVAALLAGGFWWTHQSTLLTVSPAGAPEPSASASQTATVPDVSTDFSAEAKAVLTTHANQVAPSRDGGVADWRPVSAEPRVVAFAAWARQYGASPVANRAGLIEKGRQLAVERTAQLAEWAESDPRQVLAEVVPYRVRKGLPAEVVALLEQRVNGRGALSVVMSSTLEKGQLRPGTQRTVTLNGVTHQAFTFGESSAWWSQPDAEINGVIIPGPHRSRLVFSPYPARLLEPEEARDFVASTNPEATCPVSAKRVLEDGVSEIYVIERRGLSSPFCSLAHAQSAVGGLPPEGWDARAYGGPDSGPVDTSLSLPTSGSASGTADLTVTKKLNARYLLIRHVYSDAPGTVSNSAAQSGYSKYAEALSEASYGLRTCAPLGTAVGSDLAPLSATDSWLFTVTMPKTKAEYAAGTGDVSLDTYNVVRTLLQARGQDYNNFDHFVMIDNNGLIGGGMGSVGPWYPGYAGYPAAAKMGWTWDGMNEDAEWNAFLLMHECGHNLFLPHAHRWLTNSRSIVGPGSTEEYGDGEDAMGGGDKYRGYSANYRLFLGWIPASSAPVITTSGTYRVQTFDENADATNRVLRVRHPLKTNVGYFVQRHAGINGGSDPSQFQKAASIRWGALNGQESWRLDSSQGKLGNSRFYLGNTFSDRRANVHITPLADLTDTNGKKAMDVYVSINPPATNQPPVISTFTASTLAPANGGSVTFTVSATDPEGDALAYAFDSGTGEPTKTNTTTLTRTFSTGEYPVQVRVSDMKGGVTSRTLIVRAGTPTTFTISGTLYAGGDPQAGLLVTAGSAYAFTNSDGTYTLTNLTAGSYTVAARDPVADEYLFASQTKTIGTASLSGVDFYGDNESDSVVGLSATYYSGTSFNTLKLTRRDPEIDFNWGEGSPGAGVPVDGFSARWTGKLLTTKAGGYQFHVIADQGARLYVDNVLVLDRWSATSAGSQTVWVPLLAGRYYDLKMEYRHTSGLEAQVQLAWTPPGATTAGVLPDGALTPKQNFWVAEWYNDTSLGIANYKGSRMELATPDQDFGVSAPDFPGIGTENFSVRWLGRVTAATTGTYTFHTDADDGTRLWVNGTQLINDWTVHGTLERTGTISLTAGQSYDVVLEYFQGTGGAAVKVSWTPPAGTKAVIPLASVQPPIRDGHLYAELFANKDLSGDPVVTRWDQQVNFTYAAEPDPRVPPDAWSMRWTGRVQASATGTFTFHTEADDGTRLWINGVALINDWTSHGVVEKTGTIALVSGQWYDLRLEWFDSTGGASVKLYWTPPGGTKALIPASRLVLQGGNTAPFIEPLANLAAEVSFPSAPIPFAVGDPEVAASTLSVSATSSNQAVVPNANLALGGSDAARTLAVTPIAAGTATITVTVSDGSLATTKTFVVTAVNNGSGAKWTSMDVAAAQSWSLATNWQAGTLPSGGNAASLDFLSGSALPAGTIAAANNLAGTFTCNSLVLGGTGVSGGTSNVTLSGNPLALATRASTGVLPTVSLAANRSTGTSDGLLYTVSNPLTLGADTTFNGAGTADYVFSGVLSGTGGLVKSGSSSLYLTGANTYTGPTTISGGVLLIGRTTSTGNLGTGAVTNNGTLRFVRSDSAYVVANPIGGTGPLVMGLATGGTIGAVTTLTGANTFTGAVTIFSGGLRMTRSDSLGAGTKTITITNGSAGQCRLLLDGSTGPIVLPSTLSFQTSNADAINSVIINEAGNNSIAGNFTLAGGGGSTRVRVAGGTLTLSGTFTPSTSGRYLQLDGAGNGIFSGALRDQNTTNIGRLEKLGSGTWRVTGTDHSFTGPTAVTAGTLLVNGTLTTSSSVTVAVDGVLGGSGTIGTATTVSGVHSPGDGVGTLTHSGTLTYGTAAKVLWDLAANATTANNSDLVSAAAVTVGSGAKIDLRFDSPGSTTDFSQSFWSAAHSWPVLTSTSLTGSFALGTLSNDPGGRTSAAYGVFALAHANTGVTLNWTPFVPWQRWQYTSFGSNWNNAAIAGDQVDQDRDGLLNLVEYGLGSDGAKTNGLPLVSKVSNRVTLTFPRNTGASDVVITVQGADSVSGPWTDLARSTAGAAMSSVVAGVTVTESGTGALRNVEVRDLYQTTDPARPKRFLRLQVSH